MGSGERFNYTLHSDSVNLAAHLKQSNRDHDTLVLFSGISIDQLADAYPLEPTGEVAIRGEREPVRLSKLAV